LTLPVKTSFSSTYKTQSALTAFQGTIFEFTSLRFFGGLFIISLIFGLLFTIGTRTDPASFMLSVIQAAALFWLWAAIGLSACGLGMGLLIIACSKLNILCTTDLDETGIHDKLGIFKTDIPWSKVRKIDLRSSGIFFETVVGGIHIPPDAFADNEEKLAAYELAKHYLALAEIDRGCSPSGADKNDPLLKSMKNAEEAQWRDFQIKDKDDNLG
jgi:hypothetical protein